MGRSPKAFGRWLKPDVPGVTVRLRVRTTPGCDAVITFTTRVWLLVMETVETRGGTLREVEEDEEEEVAMVEPGPALVTSLAPEMGSWL